MVLQRIAIEAGRRHQPLVAALAWRDNGQSAQPASFRLHVTSNISYKLCSSDLIYLYFSRL
jgi:hypothetical protein